MVDGIAHSGLGRQIHHHSGPVFRKCFVHQRFIRDAAANEYVLHFAGFGGFFDQAQAVFFQLRVVVIVHVVEADYRAAAHFLQQPQH
jgi:hypothetical protein